MTVTIKTALFVPTLFALGLLGLASEAKADTWGHVDQLALRLRASTEVLHDEAHQHFQQTPVYAAFDQRVGGMEKLAAHIHDLAHGVKCPVQLSRDLRELDRIQREAEYLLRQMGRWGHLDPVAFRHLGESMEDVHLTLQHLRRDLYQLERAHVHTGYHSHYPQPQVYQPTHWRAPSCGGGSHR